MIVVLLPELAIGYSENEIKQIDCGRCIGTKLPIQKAYGIQLVVLENDTGKTINIKIKIDCMKQ